VLLQFLIVVVEVAEFVREDVCVRREVERTLAVSFLHAHHVEAKAVLASDFVTLRELVDLLVFVETFELVRLASTRTPKQVPLV
jgi:hypothetical protein